MDYFNEWLDSVSDFRVKHLFLMHDANQIAVILTFYLLMVCKVGPWLMKERKAFVLKELTIAYNAVQVAANAYFFVNICRHFPTLSSPRCSEWSASNSADNLHVIQIHYYFTLLKLFDLAESFFFVLRKKANQLTFLHIYHHFVFLLTLWLKLKVAPGGVIFHFILVNSFVHFVMYIYYLTAVYTRKTNWWKKYVTALQIIQQFYLYFVYILHAAYGQSCNYPQALIYWLLATAFPVVALFVKFFYVSYMKSGKNKAN